MSEVASAQAVLLEFSDVRLAFGVSDEYSFVLHRDTVLYGAPQVWQPSVQHFFYPAGRLQGTCTPGASAASPCKRPQARMLKGRLRNLPLSASALHCVMSWEPRMNVRAKSVRRLQSGALASWSR